MKITHDPSNDGLYVYMVTIDGKNEPYCFPTVMQAMLHYSHEVKRDWAIGTTGGYFAFNQRGQRIQIHSLLFREQTDDR